jgi:Ni,Fe-hydrogenase III small subunit
MIFPTKSSCLYCDKELAEDCPHFYLDTKRTIRINMCPRCAVKMLVMTGVFTQEKADRTFSV